MGPPPSHLARAGRMNPAGISYFYLALEKETALAEVVSGSPCSAAIARFDISRDLRVLDLTNIPTLPSIFDYSRRKEREGLIFLHKFVNEITKPVRKDGHEHIEYVPSQVVSEYFALVFQINEGQHLDGILYPSAVRKNGRNLVLFPSKRCNFDIKFDHVALQDVYKMTFADCTELFTAI